MSYCRSEYCSECGGAVEWDIRGRVVCTECGNIEALDYDDECDDEDE